MTSHELARKLLEATDKPIILGVGWTNDSVITRNDVTVTEHAEGIHVTGFAFGVRGELETVEDEEDEDAN